MTPTVKLRQQPADVDVEITPDYCIQQAAQCLSNGGNFEYAKVWIEMANNLQYNNDEWMETQADVSDASHGIRTRNEIRAKKGLAPMKGGDVLTITTPTGVVLAVPS